MLLKLMKHEFHATGRIGLPLCGVMLALAVATGMVSRFWSESTYGWMERFGGIVILLYGMSVFAVSIGIFIVLMQHFKRNLLGDEGYLMRTLPVSMHELLLSKLFVALVWYAAATALILLSFVAVGLIAGVMEHAELDKLWQGIRALLDELDVGLCARAVLGWLGGMSLLTLLFYTDFSLSQTFSKHRLLYNIMGVVIFIVLLRLLFAFNGFLNENVFRAAESSVSVIGGADGPTRINITRGSIVGLVELYVSNAALYFLTWAALRFRPNID